jgi:tetratricopeptide (TPR) repeat protein
LSGYTQIFNLKSEIYNLELAYNLRVLSEIQRDTHADGDAAAATDRDAKIEQLLLAGLDHYFAAQYEQAINVWTRALFIDRNHARARAYIERARSALAERQRQSEEMLHDGVAAFRRGDGAEARRLLEAAIAGGAPSDEALAVLERLNRPVPGDAGTHTAPAAARITTASPRQRAADALTGRPGAAIIAGLIVALLALGAYLLPFLADSEPATGAAAAPIPQDLSLPLPRRGELMLARGRMLAANGRLHEALTVLDEVRATDPQKEEADRLRGEIQRQLLALTPMPPPVPAQDRRVP